MCLEIPGGILVPSTFYNNNQGMRVKSSTCRKWSKVYLENIYRNTIQFTCFQKISMVKERKLTEFFQLNMFSKRLKQPKVRIFPQTKYSNFPFKLLLTDT